MKVASAFLQPFVMDGVAAVRHRLNEVHFGQRAYKDFVLRRQGKVLEQRLVQRMSRRRQASQKAPALAFTIVVVGGQLRGIVARVVIGFVHLQGERPPWFRDVRFQICRQRRAGGCIAQKARPSQQTRIAAVDVGQFGGGHGSGIFSNDRDRLSTLGRHPVHGVGVVGFCKLGGGRPVVHDRITAGGVIEKWLQRHVGINERTAANTAGRKHVSFLECVIAVEGRRSFLPGKEIRHAVREVLQVSQNAGGLHHGQHIDQTAAMVRPGPVLYRLQLEERVQRVLRA
jgi:hypothetical protein